MTRIVVNGVSRDLSKPVNLVELLTDLGVAPDRVAIELDGSIVKKHEWPATLVRAGAKIEIVQFVGGG